MRLSKIVFVFMLLSVQVYSQTNKDNPPYVVLLGGYYSSNYGLLKNISNQNNVFLPQIGFGFPFSPKMSLTGKVGYFSKRNIHSTIWLYGNGIQFDRSGSSNLYQQMFNVGTNYKIEFSSLTSGYFNLGLSNSIIRVDQIDGRGFSFSLKNYIIGFYTGITIEQEFANLPISLLLDADYNSMTENSKLPKGQCGGFNMSIGAKYIFHL